MGDRDGSPGSDPGVRGSAIGASGIWASGPKYESYVGGWSRPVARLFIGWLSVPAEASWLDVGSGTGALAGTILELATPSAVIGIDPSQAYVAYARAHVTEARARFTVGDAHSLPLVDASFDACVSGLVLNFLDQPARAVEEMRRVTRPGGTIAAYVWDYAGEMQIIRLFWEAAAAVDADAAHLDEGRRFPIASPGALARLFTEADLKIIETRLIDIETIFADFDELWSPFLGGQGPAPGYVSSLSDMRRDKLRDRIQQSVPVRAEGGISLVARAWAVRGRRP